GPAVRPAGDAGARDAGARDAGARDIDAVAGSAAGVARALTRLSSHAAEEQPLLAVPLEDELVLVAHVGAHLLAERVLHRVAGVDQDVDVGAVAAPLDVHVLHRVADPVDLLQATGQDLLQPLVAVVVGA